MWTDRLFQLAMATRPERQARKEAKIVSNALAELLRPVEAEAPSYAIPTDAGGHYEAPQPQMRPLEQLIAGVADVSRRTGISPDKFLPYIQLAGQDAAARQQSETERQRQTALAQWETELSQAAPRAQSLKEVLPLLIRGQAMGVEVPHQIATHAYPQMQYQESDLGDRLIGSAFNPAEGTLAQLLAESKGVNPTSRYEQDAANYRATLPQSVTASPGSTVSAFSPSTGTLSELLSVPPREGDNAMSPEAVALRLLQKRWEKGTTTVPVEGNSLFPGATTEIPFDPWRDLAGIIPEGTLQMMADKGYIPQRPGTGRSSVATGQSIPSDDTASPSDSSAPLAQLISDAMSRGREGTGATAPDIEAQPLASLIQGGATQPQGMAVAARGGLSSWPRDQIGAIGRDEQPPNAVEVVAERYLQGEPAAARFFEAQGWPAARMAMAIKAAQAADPNATEGQIVGWIAQQLLRKTLEDRKKKSD